MSKKKVHFHNHDDEEVSISFECDKPQFCSVNEKPTVVHPKSLAITSISFRSRVLKVENIGTQQLQRKVPWVHRKCEKHWNPDHLSEESF